MNQKVYVALLAFIFLSFSSLLIAQAPDTLWTQTFGGGVDDDQGWSGIQVSDGGYIIGGWTFCYGAGNQDIYLIKLDSTGTTEWIKTIGGANNDLCRSIQEISTGGYIFAGRTSSYGAGSWDVYLVKLNQNGDTVWTKTIGGSADDRGNSVKETSDGGYITAGQTRTYGAGDWDVYLIKTNSSGNIQLNEVYGGIDIDRGNSAQETSDGGYIIVGETQSYGSGYFDVYLIKTDSLGNEDWSKTYGGVGDDRGLSVIETSNGQFVVAGYTTSYGSGLSDLYLIRTYINGDTIWTKTFGGIDWERGYSVIETSDGAFVITGFTYSLGAGNADVYLIKVDSSGNLIWSTTWGGANHDEAYTVNLTTDGGYVITGYTESFGPGHKDVYVIKTGPDPTSVYEEIPAISPPLSIKHYPNPARDKVTINYTLSKPEDVEIQVFNLLGQKVKTLTDKEENKGTHSIVWDIRNNAGNRVPKGFYFLRAEIGGFSETKRLTIIN